MRGVTAGLPASISRPTASTLWWPGCGAINPAVIPRNHALQAALDAAERAGDTGPVKRLLKLVSHPFDEPADAADLTDPPAGHAPSFVTYCGT